MRAIVAIAVAVAACGDGGGAPVNAAAAAALAHSGSIAVSSDGATVYVVNADADSVSLIDTATSALTAEVALAPRPTSDGNGFYTPAVMPRALALSPDGRTLYVTGERASALYAIDLATNPIGATIAAIHVGSEPIGVVASPDGAAVFVACSNDGTVVRVDAATHQVTGTAQVAGEPWALGWSPSGALFATLFVGPGLARIDPATLAVTAVAIPDTPPRGDPRLAHGEVRGIYDVAARPPADATRTSELWAAHVMLGTDTPQPTLDFESTVFPSLSVVDTTGDASGDTTGAYQTTLSTDAQDIPGIDGAFADVVSGPHAIAFTRDGAYAIVADAASEDLLVVDAATRVEASLLRPLPGHQPEGVALAPDDSVAYVDERNSGDVAIVAVDGATLTVTGTVPRFASAGDPMPALYRLGQHLFYSANSDEYPLTQNHWVACASCHLEGRSDAVTWQFLQGPRDTPSNAGGMLDTGFLFRTADRSDVIDYWRTIDLEQGGSFDPNLQAPLLFALERFVDFAMPLPIPPTTDPALVAQGEAIFNDPTVGCASCHGGPRHTDSGAGNPELVLTSGPVVLHDVGTCVVAGSAGGFPDVAHTDIDGDPRQACLFDTPSLSGIASSPPYLHDGSAPTLLDVLEHTRGTMGNITGLASDQEAALVEYLRSL